ncbi:zinc ribbon domain-containing protein [Achromobacter sp. NPDC058515]|uniref:zinc ribbon domain-containing protein n=1 Tax=Achromobacter sp. NPDC058515 TaxID=3346533 RepID=UPI00364C4939
MSVDVSQCRACGHRVYPARLWCPACGHDRAQAVAVEYAELQAWTAMPAKGADAPAIIATARACPQGPVLVLRLEEMPSHAGQRLRLFERRMQGQSLPWASVLPA